MCLFSPRRPSHCPASAQVQGNGYDLCQHQLRLLQLQRPQLVCSFLLLPAFHSAPGSATESTADWGLCPSGSWLGVEVTRGQGHLCDSQHGGVPLEKAKSSIVTVCSVDEPPLQEDVVLRNHHCHLHVSLGQRSTTLVGVCHRIESKVSHDLSKRPPHLPIKQCFVDGWILPVHTHLPPSSMLSDPSVGPCPRWLA